MQNLIPVIEDVVFNATFADLPRFDFSDNSRYIKNENNVRFIIQALADDILCVREDKEINMQFYFGTNHFDITLGLSYPYFHYKVTFSFNYEYPDLKKNIRTILNNELDRIINEEGVQYRIVEIEPAKGFFKNLAIFEEVFDTHGQLYNHLCKYPFKSGTGESKDAFQFFTLIKMMNGIPSICLKCPIFEVLISHYVIQFDFKGIELSFNNDFLYSDNRVNTIRELIINLFNSKNNYNVTAIDNLKSITAMISI